MDAKELFGEGSRFGAMIQSWEHGYNLLLDHLDAKGHVKVDLAEEQDGFWLGHWVARQRLRKSELSSGQKSMLEKLPDWEWVSRVRHWHVGFDRLLQYVEREGHARVIANHLEDGFKLGQWVRDQRVRRHRMTAEKSVALESLPGWVWDAWKANWQSGYERLLAFVEREGHARVPVSHKEGRTKLGVWVRAQRMRRAKLSPERVAMLELLPGWVWDASSRLRSKPSPVKPFIDNLESSIKETTRPFVARLLDVLNGKNICDMTPGELLEMAKSRGWQNNVLDMSLDQFLNLIDTAMQRGGLRRKATDLSSASDAVVSDCVDSGLAAKAWSSVSDGVDLGADLSDKAFSYLMSNPWCRRGDFIRAMGVGESVETSVLEKLLEKGIAKCAMKDGEEFWALG